MLTNKLHKRNTFYYMILKSYCLSHRLYRLLSSQSMQLASYNLKATEKIVAGSTLKIGDNKL